MKLTDLVEILLNNIDNGCTTPCEIDACPDLRTEETQWECHGNCEECLIKAIKGAT